ncbi:MAG: prenyltransferase/squalene oxidase repeat-containing protein [Solirubrobacterales bacterium]
MSWREGSYLILALVLLGGFAWYERSRPPSQTVALVAAMAALAVAGRVAFPILPNVVATTDVVLFTGYAIGAAPGFVVGALAGLISNFWLGQGPWTPWQMAGWGICGLFGAALAVLSRRRLGRIGLAAACGLAGVFYGALLDYSLMATYGGEQSLDRFLALSARGVPFNVAHAAGNIAIALVAGPAMVRMLVRFRERFEVTWGGEGADSTRPPIPSSGGVGSLPAIVLASLALALGGLSNAVAPSQAASGGSAVSWLRGIQNGDGGFGTGPGVESDPSMTGWVSLGLEAAGINPLDLDRGASDPIAYLRANADQVRSLGDIERTVLVLRGAGLGARDFGGRDLVPELRRQRGPDGSFGGQVNLAAFGVLALEAAGAKNGNARSADWMAGVQNPDGGWGFAPRTQSDADSTGAAMQALAAVGGQQGPLRKAVGYLRTAERTGGGFPLAQGAVNSQSTAWAVQGLVAAGASPASLRRGGTPLGYLGARRAADGHYRYSAASDQTPAWVTGQVLLAVNRRPFPLAAVPRAPEAAKERPTADPAAVAQAAVPGGGGSAAQSPRRGGAAPASAAEVATDGGVSGTTAPTADTPAVSRDDAGSGTPSPALLAAGGLAAACAVAAAGWLFYRRRLP